MQVAFANENCEILSDDWRRHGAVGHGFMYQRARKVAQELRKVRASRELSRTITTRQTALYRCCTIPVKLAVMSSVITMHQESIYLYISRWLQAATQQMNIKQYVYITLCILYIFVVLELVELLSWLLDYYPRPIHIMA